jgi:hypothetical protein
LHELGHGVVIENSKHFMLGDLKEFLEEMITLWSRSHAISRMEMRKT